MNKKSTNKENIKEICKYYYEYWQNAKWNTKKLANLVTPELDIKKIRKLAITYATDYLNMTEDEFYTKISKEKSNQNGNYRVTDTFFKVFESISDTEDYKKVLTIIKENAEYLESNKNKLANQLNNYINVYRTTEKNLKTELTEKLQILKAEEKTEENYSEPLYSIDASKYINNEAMGFVVTEGNKEYSLSDYEFDVVVAVVAAEYHNEYPDDALAVVSVILNRCDSAKWVSWAGSTPYSQVITKGQFEVYFTTNENISYKRFMPGGSKYGSSKYAIAKQAVLDGFNGIRNNSYLGFRSGSSVSYSDYYIVPGGNRYGYN